MAGEREADVTAAAFDRAAVDFSRLSPLLWDPVGAATVAVSAPAAGERVLDACCGDGASAIPAARRVGGTGAVDAVDLSGPMVGLLRERAAGLPQLTAHQADVTSWPGTGYDVVQCVLGAFFFPDMAAGTDHLVGRVRPGGRVAVTIWHRDAMVAAGRAIAGAAAAERGERAQVPRASSAVQQLGDPDAFGAWLTARGLEQVAVSVAAHAVEATEEALWLLVLGSGFRGLLTELDDAAVDRVRGRYLEQLVGGPAIDATTLVGFGQRPD
ncbi:class I SAM-dependent methyltransferase [Modestobacter marinus]|uniref:Methyltransferase n=1 Tax=Modestobacter marinus TaxID=477641 RepID=A0A846LSY1_9ACTN|nr:class I SAM-dependent methyltransferase [Modestobacter marinus]NIH68735.1 SAM-dependent methyltransferase [Modestobacter marinus]GGL59698.1 methyltransferase [Modestobacter marinus]